MCGDMILDSEEKLHTFYNNYAYEFGFGVRKISTKTKGEVKYYTLACSRGSKYVCKANSSKVRLSTKTEFQAKISVIVHSSGKCTISSVHLYHNHALSPTKSRYQRSHKKMDSYSKRKLELNDCAGIPLIFFFHSLVVEAKGYENLQFGEKDCRNYIAKLRQLRLGVGDAEALRNYFTHARSRAAYDSFGDVVSFDSTYLTNRYNMPFSLLLWLTAADQLSPSLSKPYPEPITMLPYD
ncbi:hypothetical protein Lal_00018745 [Lupinus albus]|nr:hypothetical protein Lal_00018745 [Lupinus albus]